MQLADYPARRELYQKLSEIVRDSIQEALSPAKKYGVHHIQCRAKELESLHQWLKKHQKEQADNIEEIKFDLSGCRVIFYSNNDVNKFLQSGIIQDNFKIHYDKTKIHHPSQIINSANDYYMANHYVVELKEEKTSLEKYKNLSGLLCEIPLYTTIFITYIIRCDFCSIARTA